MFQKLRYMDWKAQKVLWRADQVGLIIFHVLLCELVRKELQKGTIRRSHASSALQIVQFGLNFQPEKAAYYKKNLIKRLQGDPKIIPYGMKIPTI